MNILVVNDDGIKAEGLKVLVEALKPLGNIYIFAPEHPQSGKAQSLSLRKHIKTKDYKNLYGAVKAYSVTGTPADSLRLGLQIYADVKFDFVASGINKGANLGADINHSGTVGAAAEAASLGIPAFAISSPYGSYEMAKIYTTNIIKHLYETNNITSEYILNINYPSKEFKKPKGILYTTQGEFKHEPFFHKKGKNKYLAQYKLFDIIEAQDTDVYGYLNGMITITPVFEDRSRKETVNLLNKKTKLNELINCDKINNR